jgi:hypothetical protein
VSLRCVCVCVWVCVCVNARGCNEQKTTPPHEFPNMHHAFISLDGRRQSQTHARNWRPRLSVFSAEDSRARCFGNISRDCQRSSERNGVLKGSLIILRPIDQAIRTGRSESTKRFEPGGKNRQNDSNRAVRIDKAMRTERSESATRFGPGGTNRQSDSNRAVRIDKAIRTGRCESTKRFEPGGPNRQRDSSRATRTEQLFEPGPSNGSFR